MARTVAIVIGVQEPAGLPALSGTWNDVAEVSAWATKSEYEVVAFTDENKNKVRIGDLYDAVDALVVAQDVERLLVFFSGHGVSKGPGIDYWILSDGVRNPSGPVSVDLSLRNAKRSGIPHIVFFADACRTAANKRENAIEGASMFPNDVVGRDVHMDLFLATATGDPAVERQQSDAELEKAYGVFTRCLLTALHGKAPVALEEHADHKPRRAVTAFPLEKYLDEAVVAAAADLNPPVRQIPDSTPGSQYPHLICWVPDRRGRNFGADVTEPVAPEGDTARVAALAELEGGIAADAPRLSATGRGHFETGTGLSVLGSPVLDVAGPATEGHAFEEDGAFHVRGSDAAPVVLDLGDGRYAACAMLRGFVGTLHVGDSGVDLVSYLPTEGSPYYEGPDLNDKSREQLAFLGAASRVGFRNWAIDEARGHADVFRQSKLQNPSYGIFAAYAYARAGAQDQVKDMLGYFKAAGQDVPFDLVLLAEEDPTTAGVPVVPSYPLLSRGWALLEPEEIHPAVRGALLSLAPAVWATPTGDGGRGLFEAVKSGEVR